MPDIIILPSSKELDELRTLLRLYRKDSAEDYEIEEFVTSLMGKTFELSKRIHRIIND